MHIKSDVGRHGRGCSLLILLSGAGSDMPVSPLWKPRSVSSRSSSQLAADSGQSLMQNKG